ILAFNTLLPAGLHLISARQIFNKIKTLSQIISEAEYEVDLNGIIPDERVLNNVLSAEEIPTKRRVKGKDKIVDIRPYIDSIDNDGKRLKIRTRVVDNRTVRISEILSLLFNDTIEQHHFQIHRKAQLVRIDDSVMTPLEMVQ
ncbi:DUF2344 domain-containing protein, partial [bacterium]|nr:DUF2344 domain-containing protein [bacterium]